MSSEPAASPRPFTTLAADRTMGYMVRRSTALLLSAVLVALTASVWTQCAGWDSSAQARDACCTHAGHETTPEQASGCCAAVEPSRHATLAGHVFHLPALVAILTIHQGHVMPRLGAALLFPSIDPVERQSPPPLFLRHVSFLI